MENYLIHYGVPLMKWGHRRYQHDDGTWTEEGLERRRNGIASGHTSLKDRIKEKKKQKTREKNLKKARAAKAKKAEEKKKQEEQEAKEAKRKEKFEQEKQKILMSGKASDVLKYKGLLTNQELSTVVSRLDYEKKLSDMKDREIKTGWDKTEALMKRVGQLTDWTIKATNMYNAIAKVSNAVGGTEMPIIGEKKEEKKEDRSNIEKIIKSGDVDKILAISGKMNTSELKEANERITYLKKLKDNRR